MANTSVVASVHVKPTGKNSIAKERILIKVHVISSLVSPVPLDTDKIYLHYDICFEAPSLFRVIS